ncbi:hypothetical protein GCM10023153_07020 [Ornithinibacter aureus]|uniref:Uncharacterized protein n=1 Tax=Ornithinibacter aureus TaxID=622664 RepID=A0ABP8JG81_9MICO|nr:hypothetical protein [Ornithinibacter aureus]
MSSWPSRCCAVIDSTVAATHAAGDADAVALAVGVALTLALGVADEVAGGDEAVESAPGDGLPEHPVSTKVRAAARAPERRAGAEVTGRRYVSAPDRRASGDIE